MAGEVAETPERVGRYEILLPIAKGGMATVYLARAEGHGGFDRYVALKLTLPHLRKDPEFAAHLLDEAKIVAHIRHTNVVPVLDVGQDELGVFLVMEYVPGESLAGMYREAAKKDIVLPPRIGLRALVDALEGLHAAHEHGDEDGHPLHVVHRDFSPQNILLATDGVARLTDFGIAKAASRVSSTGAGQIKGKMSYVSPEQAQGAPLDRRCDLWAAGIIAWEIMVGRKLNAPNDKSSLVSTVKREPPLIRTVAPDAPKAMEEVIASILKLDPDHRPATAALVARDLTTAAKKAGMLADTHEVSEYVKLLTGPILAERKLQLSAARRRRMESYPDGMGTAMGLPSLPITTHDSSPKLPVVPTPTPSPQTGAVEPADEDDGSIAVTAESEPPPPPKTPPATTLLGVPPALNAPPPKPVATKPAPAKRAPPPVDDLGRSDESAMSLEIPRSPAAVELGTLGLPSVPALPEADPSEPQIVNPLFGEAPRPPRPARAERAPAGDHTGDGDVPGLRGAFDGILEKIPKDKRVLVIGAVAAGFIGLILIVVATLSLASGRDASADAGAGAEMEAATSAPATSVAAASTSTGTTTPADTPPAVTGAVNTNAGAIGAGGGEVNGVQFLALKANAPVTEVRVGDRVIDMVIPAPNVNVELMPDETVHALRISARSTDGRQANVELGRGELEGSLAFGAAGSQPPPQQRVQPPPTQRTTGKPPPPPPPKPTNTPRPGGKR